LELGVQSWSNVPNFLLVVDELLLMLEDFHNFEFVDVRVVVVRSTLRRRRMRR